MEREHKKAVRTFLTKANMKGSFTFLDVGCGNGWVVRMIAGLDECTSSMGIDVSKMMIKNARAKTESRKEAYLVADIEEWNTRKKFDRVFSMETIYYARSPERFVEKIFNLLNPGGLFFCGMDFYSDNRATSNWPEKMNLRMHLLSRMEWRKMFEDAGFQVRTILVKDKTDRRKWRREFGTLFITGTKG